MKQLTALAMTTFLLFGPMSIENTLADQNMPSKQRMNNSFEQFKSNLNLNDEQSAHWQSYMKAMQEMRGLYKEMRQAKKQNKGEAVSPVAKLDQKISFMEKQSEALKKVRGALNTLYSSLSPEQQAKFQESSKKMQHNKRKALKKRQANTESTQQ